MMANIITPRVYASRTKNATSRCGWHGPPEPHRAHGPESPGFGSEEVRDRDAATGVLPLCFGQHSLGWLSNPLSPCDPELA